MNLGTAILLLLCSSVQPSPPIVTLSFLSGPPIRSVPLHELHGDSVRIGDGQWIHLNRIVRIEVSDPSQRPPELWRALQYGAIGGAALGAAVGSLFKRERTEMFVPSTYFPEGIAIGCAVGVFGAIAWASSEPTGTIYDLAGAPMYDRRTVIRLILARHMTVN